MNLPQENFERALDSAGQTLTALGTSTAPVLKEQSPQRLKGWLWDLEAIAQAIRHDLLDRERNDPIDLA